MELFSIISQNGCGKSYEGVAVAADMYHLQKVKAFIGPYCNAGKLFYLSVIAHLVNICNLSIPFPKPGKSHSWKFIFIIPKYPIGQLRIWLPPWSRNLREYSEISLETNRTITTIWHLLKEKWNIFRNGRCGSLGCLLESAYHRVHGGIECTRWQEGIQDTGEDFHEVNENKHLNQIEFSVLYGFETLIISTIAKNIQSLEESWTNVFIHCQIHKLYRRGDLRDAQALRMEQGIALRGFSFKRKTL